MRKLIALLLVLALFLCGCAAEKVPETTPTEATETTEATEEIEQLP